MRALLVALTAVLLVGEAGARERVAAKRGLTAAQWTQKLGALRPGMELSEVQQTIRPKRITVGRVFTRSGGAADLVLDDRYSVTIAIEPEQYRLIWVGTVERLRR